MHDVLFISIGVYYGVSLLIVLIDFVKKKWRNQKHMIVYILFVVVLIPFFGLLFIMFTRYFPKKKTGLTIDDFEVSFLSVEKKESYMKLNLEKEFNIIPIEEALLINNNKTKRRLLIDALKQDMFTCATFLLKAVRDKDSETSHYAAAALMELKNKFVSQLQSASTQFEMDENNSEICLQYADVIKRYIESGLLDKKSVQIYKYLYIKILTIINRLEPEKKEYFVQRVNTELELFEYKKAEETCMQFLSEHPNFEEPYLMLLKLYYALRDYNNFRNTLKSLKSSQIKLSYYALSKVRFWMDVDKR